MINRKISIGTVQFAINTEQNSHMLAEHPLGSISRMFSELLSQNLSFIGFQSDNASLIISKPELNTTKQLIYTSMLPIETARKIFDERFYDYLIFGELKFETTLKAEITLINRFNDKSLRRELSLKSYDFFELSVNIIEESLKLMDLTIDLSDLKKLISYSTDNIKSWGWYSLSYEKELDNQDKILSLEKSLPHSPNFDIAKLKKAIIEFEETNNPENLNNICKTLDNDLINYFAFQYELIKENFIAFNLYKISYYKNLNQPGILYKLIKLSYNNNDNKNLKLYINKYISDINGQDFDYDNIPLYMYFAGEENLAIEKLNKGIELNPDNAKIYTTLAYIYMSKENFTKASELYEKSFSLIKDVNVLEDWTSVLIKQKDYKKVIDLINKYNDDLVLNSGILCNLGLSYIALDQKNDALKALEKGIKIDKNNSKLNSLLGNIYLEQKAFSRAQKYFYLALQSEPNNYLWNINMGDLYFEQENFEEADKYYIKALDINNSINIPKKLICEGHSFEKIKMFQEAINKYIKASKFLPENFLPIMRISEIFILNNDYDMAIDILEKNIDKFPLNINLWNTLLKLYKIKQNSFFGGKWKKKVELTQNKINELKK